MTPPILISFSGGRTSAFMTKFLMEHHSFQKREKLVCFANTGKEFEETLQFVNECDKRWNLNVVWLEPVVIPEKGKGTRHKVVDFNTASRYGEPFESVIKKYGVPSKGWPHCTRELKQKPIKSYMKSLGYSSWLTAIGIRSDEQHRLNRKGGPDTINPIYPLVDNIQVDKGFIREWWDRQAFHNHLNP